MIQAGLCVFIQLLAFIHKDDLRLVQHLGIIELQLKHQLKKLTNSITMGAFGIR